MDHPRHRERPRQPRRCGIADECATQAEVRLENHDAEPLEEFDLCKLTGKGALYQVAIAAKGGSLTYLEACMRACLSGIDDPLMLSSGLEDYFMGTYYFDTGKFHADFAGLTHFDKKENSFSAYRFHDVDPVIFQDGLRLTCRCGETEHGNADEKTGYLNPLKTRMFWWQKVAAQVVQGRCKQFGFITTNSIYQTFNRRILGTFLADTKKPPHLAYAIPDHPWVDSADGAAVRIAMTVAAPGAGEGILEKVITEQARADGENEVTLLRSWGHSCPQPSTRRTFQISRQAVALGAEIRRKQTDP